MINKLIKFLVNLKWKREHFYTFSWGIDENTGFCIMSEEYYTDWYRRGGSIMKYKKGGRNK